MAIVKYMHADEHAEAVSLQHEVGDWREEEVVENPGVGGIWERRCLMSPGELGLRVFEVCLEE